MSSVVNDGQETSGCVGSGLTLHCQLVGGKDYLNVQNELNICTTDMAYSQTLIQSLETWCATCREDVSDDGQ